MKKLPILLLLSVLIAQVCSAQQKTTADTTKVKRQSQVSVQHKPSYVIGFSPSVFKKLISQQFSTLLSGKTNNGIGNYADLDITDGQVSFQGSSISNSGSVFSIKATGGVDEGLFNIFDHSKLNSNLSLEFKYDFLSLEKQKLFYEDRSYRKYQVDSLKAEQAYKEQELFLKKNQQITIWKTQNLQLLKQKEKLMKLLDSLTNKSPKTPKDSLLADSTTYNVAKNQYQLDTLQNTLATAVRPIFIDNDNANDRVAKIDKLLEQVDIVGFEFGWFSISYKATATDFKLFNSAEPFDSQVTKRKFVGHEAKFQWSHYKWADISNQTFFWDIGAGLSFSDNLADLKKLELVEETQYSATPEARKSIKKYNVYSGEYENDLLGLKFYGDYYKFFLNNNIMAIHVYPEYALKRKLKPVLNTGFGLLFSFKNNKKDASVVNAELYYNFLDVFKTTDVDYRLFERNEIGIRFVFPLTFKTYK